MGLWLSSYSLSALEDETTYATDELEMAALLEMAIAEELLCVMMVVLEPGSGVDALLGMVALDVPEEGTIVAEELILVAEELF